MPFARMYPADFTYHHALPCFPPPVQRRQSRTRWSAAAGGVEFNRDAGHGDCLWSKNDESRVSTRIDSCTFAWFVVGNYCVRDTL